MTKTLTLLLSLGLFVPALASATVHMGTIQGDEAQATTCSIGSTSQIVGTVTYDDASGLFSWMYTFGDNAPAYDNGVLFDGGAAMFAHFHGPAEPGVVSGNIQVSLTTDNPNSGSTSITPTQAAGLLGELWYLNIHSPDCLGGELRGQVLFAPGVPGLSGWMLFGLLALLLATTSAVLYRMRAA